MRAEGKGYNASKNASPLLKFNEQNEMVLLGVDIDEVKVLATQLSLPKEDLERMNFEGITGDALVEMFSKSSLWIEETLSFATEKLPATGSKFDTEAFWRTLIGNVSKEKGPAPQCYEEYYMSYRKNRDKALKYMRSERHNLPTMTLEESLKKRAEYGITPQLINEPKLFEQEMFNSVVRRKVCVTKKGRLAVPELTLPTDQTFILAGSKVPWVTRPFRHQTLVKEEEFNESHIVLMVECYVHGLMGGEGLEGGEMREFTIH
jgi:hypothetical protein